VVATITGIVLLVLSGRYGYHRDELYFLAAGRHLAWGYPDQPPLTPLLARAMSGIASHSLVVLRLPSTLSAAAVVLLAGLMAERLGAQRSGQWVASIATALCGLVLGVGHLLSTATTALLGEVLITYLVLRLLQGGDRRLWLLVGVAGGLTFQANVLVGFVLLALALALPRRPGPWVAGALTLAIGLPYLVWQAQHDWPQHEIARNIAAGGSGSSVPRSLFLVMLVLQIGPWLLPIWWLGLRRLLRDRRLRCFGLAFVGLVVLFVALGGKPYYVGGLVPLLLAAGAQPTVDRFPRAAVVAMLALSSPALLFTLPVLPASQTGAVIPVNNDVGETIGWPSFVRQVEAAVPPGAVVVTSNYGEAGALDRYGSVPAFSGHNGYGLWRIPPGSTTALTVGMDRRLLDRICSHVQQVGHVQSAVDTDEDGAVLATCTPREPWSRLWPEVRHLG